jgi:hypothetical protein
MLNQFVFLSFNCRWWRHHGRLETHSFIHDYRACKSAAVVEQDPEAFEHLQPIALIDQSHALHMMFSLRGEAPQRQADRSGSIIQSAGKFLIFRSQCYRHHHLHLCQHQFCTNFSSFCG